MRLDLQRVEDPFEGALRRTHATERLPVSFGHGSGSLAFLYIHRDDPTQTLALTSLTGPPAMLFLQGLKLLIFACAPRPRSRAK